MRTASLLVLAAVLGIPRLAGAQTTQTVGPDPDSPSTLTSLGSDAALWRQDFLAPAFAFRLTSFSFWWSGTPADRSVYYIAVGFTDDPTEDSPTMFISPGPGGWLTLDPDMLVDPGQRIFFWMVANNGDLSDYDETILASVKVTDTDAYPYGTFGEVRSRTLSGDLLFRAEFEVTPEPWTVLLLFTGLLGIGLLLVRQRRPLAL